VKAGDTVRLKSGGPFMTVDGIAANNSQARCIWHDQAGRLQAAWISLPALNAEKPVTITWPTGVVPFERKHL
jgi:uncharacterized protein YodC (DUF2158 family)